MTEESASIHEVIEPTSSCVVYDPRSGRIVHVHSVVAEPGARIPSREQVAEDALEIARESSGRQVKGLKALHVDPRDIVSGEPKRVEVKKLTLVSAKRRRPVKQQGTRKVKRKR